MEFNTLTPIAIVVCLTGSFCAVSTTPLGASRGLVLTLLAVAVSCFALGATALGAAFSVWALATVGATMGAIAVAPPPPSAPRIKTRQEWLAGIVALGVFGVCYRSAVLALRQSPGEAVAANWDGWIPLGLTLICLAGIGWQTRRKYG